MSILVQGITSLRVVSAIVFVATSVHPDYQLISLIVYLIGLASDVIDGSIARRFRVTSRAGGAYDAFADKALNVVSALYGAAIGAPMIACALVILRDLFVLSFRAIAGDEAILPPSRLKGFITGTPVKILTIVVVADRAFAGDTSISLQWYWLAGAISGLSLLLDVWRNRRVIAQYFRYQRADIRETSSEVASESPSPEAPPAVTQ